MRATQVARGMAAKRWTRNSAMVGQSPAGSAAMSGSQGGGDLVEQRPLGGIVVEAACLEAGRQRPRGRIGRLAARGQFFQQAAEGARLGALQRLRLRRIVARQERGGAEIA